jgi:hypothetical protein
VTVNSAEVMNSIGVSESYKVFYSKNITNSSDVYFSTNLIGCHDCIACDGLENANHMINNKKYNPEEYLLKRDEILRKKEDFLKIWNHIHRRPVTNFASTNIE